MKRTLLIGLCLLTYSFAQAQNTFDSPLKLPTALSGTFAEIRPYHYHGGIDMRVGGDTGVGTPIYAPADGYVSRVHISPWSGGKMLYINHADNKTTVYYHCDGFPGSIGDFVYRCQEAKQCYAFDTTLPAGLLKVQRGDLIAYAGNTGMSGGPHLHYEVRDTRTQHGLNPLGYGITMTDVQQPTIRGLRMIPYNERTRIAGKCSDRQVKDGETILIAGRFYLGVYAADLSEGSTNNNGFERIDIWVDGVPFFQYRVTEIDHDNARGIHCQLDYEYYQTHKKPYIITRRLPGDPLRPARTYGDGSIGFIDTDTSLHRITVAVSDWNGNQSLRRFNVRNSLETLVEMHGVPHRITPYQTADTLVYTEPLSVGRSNYQIDLPPDVLYYNDALVHGVKTDKRHIAPILTVAPRVSPYPPHKTYKIRLPLPVGYDEEKLVICYLDDTRTKACPTRLDGKWLEADVRDFGNFTVMQDTAAPTVRPVGFKNGSRITGNLLQLKMTDDLSGVKEYKCYINGRWVLAEYDGKYNLLNIKDVRARLTEPKNTLRIVLTDGCDNTRDVTYTLLR